MTVLTGLDRSLLGKTIGSSECSTPAGLNPFEHPSELYGRLVGEIESKPDTMYTILGRLLEPHILQWYSDEVGMELAFPRSIVHPDRPWARDTPDAIALHNGKRAHVVDAKLVFPTQSVKWEDTDDGVPEDKICQMTWHMDFYESDICDVPVWLIPPRGAPIRRIYRLTHSTELSSVLWEVNERFWCENVLAHVPPTVDGSKSARRSLEARFPRSTEVLLPSTDEAVRWARQSFDARSTIKLAKALKDEADNRLVEMIGDAAGIEGIAMRRLEGKVTEVAYTKNPARVLRLKYEED